MNYKAHFLKGDILNAEEEVSCLIDLCGEIAINAKKGNIAQANAYKDDLLKSLRVITELNEAKQNNEKMWSLLKQVKGSEQQKELLRKLSI